VKLLSEIFAKRLKEERENKHWTQDYFASLLGISNGTVSGYERNYREPDIDTLIKISDLFNISIDYLIGKSDKRDSVNPKNTSKNTLSDEINKLPDDKRKMIETMLKVFKTEQESDDDSTKNNVDFLK
jgi:transcriptional regulator with XRE-family HTH domain